MTYSKLSNLGYTIFIYIFFQSMGKSLTFEQSVLDAVEYQRRHRCKDPLCETQLWKARHELDLALIKLEKMKEDIL